MVTIMFSTQAALLFGSVLLSWSFGWRGPKRRTARQGFWRSGFSLFDICAQFGLSQNRGSKECADLCFTSHLVRRAHSLL